MKELFAVFCSLLLLACDDPATTVDTERLVAAPGELDVFLIAGQSNALGAGDSAQSPLVPEGRAYEWDTKKLVLREANDPVGGARTGSAWPAFANRYQALTGRTPVLVGMARSASAQHESATTSGGNWDATGTLYPAATRALRLALDELSARGYVPVLRGVLWDQGGRDAQAIDAAQTTKEQYKSALIAMLGRFRGDFGATTDFWIIRLGTQAGESTRGWQAVRDAQEEVAAIDPHTYIAYRETIRFYPAFHRDRFHYDQAGLNRIGEGTAEFIAEELFGIAH